MKPTFGQYSYGLEELSDAVATYMSQADEKIHGQNSLAGGLVF